jgi:methionyl-tRNA formyltransferase
MQKHIVFWADYVPGERAMRIVFIGERALGEKVLEELLKREENVVGVYTSPDKPGINNRVKILAASRGIPAFPLHNMSLPEVYTEYIQLKAELNIMAHVSRVFPESILNYPRFGTIEWHPSLLPRHGGPNPIGWPIIQGDIQTGITMFWPDSCLDTGPILLQKKVTISFEDTAASLYYDKIFPISIAAVMEALDLIKKGKAPRIAQDRSQATYDGPLTEKEAHINWQKPALEIYNLIRGTDPDPGATTTWQGQIIKLYGARYLNKPVSGAPGEITAITPEGMTLAAPHSGLLIRQLARRNGLKIDATAFSLEFLLHPGQRFGGA